MSLRTRTRPWLLLVLAAGACAGRPARFADRPAVTTASDRAPSPVPRRSRVPDEGDLDAARLRRSVVDSLETTRIPDAGDVNAIDEVPRSTWFATEPASDAGPPVLPLTALAEAPVSGLGGLAVVDALGVRYELRRDAPGSPTVSTANEVISAGILRALGYRAAEVHLLRLAPDDQPRIAGWRSTTPLRVSATRWPPGLDVGPTPLSAVRADDPNDRIPHPDRRTLRALREVFAWLMVGRLDARVLRDVYLGAPGRGHVEHFVLGSADAIVAEVVPAQRKGSPAGPRLFRNAAVELFTLGLLAPPVDPGNPSTMVPEVRPVDYLLEPPWEPLERTLPADSFWIARRMMAIPRTRIDSMVAEADVAPASGGRDVARILDARRRSIASKAFAAVTPCTWVGLDRAAILLRDEAVTAGLSSAASSRYRVEMLDDEGDEITPESVVTGEGERVRVALPTAATGDRDRVIVRVTALRGGRPAPRALELHVALAGGAPRVIALRH